MTLEVSVTSSKAAYIDGHEISVAEWNGILGGISSANGSIINEGPLSGLLNEVSRVVTLDIGDNSEISLIEEQRVDRILSPSIVTFDENTPPMLSSNSESSVGFRESVLSSEGGIAHLELFRKSRPFFQSIRQSDISGRHESPRPPVIVLYAVVAPVSDTVFATIITMTERDYKS